jgi:SAM-dependent methyltransferase
VGCGTGYWTAYYTARGADYTGVDIAPTSVARLANEYPASRFVHLDVGESPVPGRFELVNAFDVLYHLTDDARWEQALRHLAGALDPGGLLVITDAFREFPAAAEHNRMRSLDRYLSVLEPLGLVREQLRPTHVLLNRHLGPWRFLNRLPGLLLAVDRAILAAGGGRREDANKLLLMRRR